MKKYIFSLMLSFCSILSLSAMSYEEAREQARFLTDKMAYELNLNDQQYNDCYEINLDYLLSVETADDIYGDYLAYRNADLRHILYDWQYTIFAAADYFFRPLAWLHNRWFFPIYRHYHAGYYYYGFPTVYYSYRGGHGRFYHHDGFYVSRRPHWNGGFRGMDRHPMNHHGSVGRGGHNGRDFHTGRSGGRGSDGYRIGDGSHNGRNGGRSSDGYRIGDGSHNGRNGGRSNDGYRIGDGSRTGRSGGRGNDGYRIGDGSRNGHSGDRGSDGYRIGDGSHNSGHDNIGRGNTNNNNHSGHDYVGRGNSGGYDHPSSTRTTVHSSSSRSSGSYGGSHSSSSRSSGISSGSRSSSSRSGGFSSSHSSSTRSSGISSGSHSSSSRGGGFGGGSRGGGSHSGGSHGGGHGGGRGR